MNDIEDKLNKILKLYRQFQNKANKELAEDIEQQIDVLKAIIRDRFYELTFYCRISNEITIYLDSLNKKVK